jgi:hypothetical protein
MLLLAAWGARWFPVLAARGGVSWHFFADAGQLFAGGHPAGAGGKPGGLHIYASYPKYQFGPVTLVFSAVVRLVGSHEGLVAAQVLMTVCGLAVLYLLERTARLVRPDLTHDEIRWTVLGAGVVFVPVWMILAVRFAHLDDVLGLLFAVLAVRAFVAGRGWLVGVLLALSAGAKPWAFSFMVLLFALPGRKRWQGIAWAADLTLLLWAPFVIADHGSVSAARFAIANVSDSGLRALGITVARTPWWDRYAQVLLGAGLGLAAVWRGRWPAVVILGCAARVALDPSSYTYYDAGILVGAVMWDLMGARRTAPVWSLATVSLLVGETSLAREPTIGGDLRLGFVVAAALMMTLGSAWSAGPAGADNARLVGEDHELRTVPGA